VVQLDFLQRVKILMPHVQGVLGQVEGDCVDRAPPRIARRARAVCLVGVE